MNNIVATDPLPVESRHNLRSLVADADDDDDISAVFVFLIFPVIRLLLSLLLPLLLYFSPDTENMVQNFKQLLLRTEVMLTL